MITLRTEKWLMQSAIEFYSMFPGENHNDISFSLPKEKQHIHLSRENTIF